jgi:hypothetical protein
MQMVAPTVLVEASAAKARCGASMVSTAKTMPRRTARGRVGAYFGTFEAFVRESWGLL